MSPLILFLLLSQAPAAQDYVGNVPSFSLNAQNRHQYQLITRGGQYTDRFDKGTCFTMRTYYFKRQDGQAPVLSGTATCTPSNTLRMDQVKQPPRVRLVPAD